MASSTAPSTPDNGPPPTLRRAFTVPAKLTRPIEQKARINEPEAPLIETLFIHQSGKIISFSPPVSNSRPNPGSARQREESSDGMIGSLPWVSYTERTVATGPLCIYRVPNMVSFLNSGSILRPILAKSQCWCVDGATKFVLRISQNQYYRIELPNNREEDMEKAEELKKVLAKVLQYETTPCPFQRSFTVQLPDPPTTPVRRRPWRPPARTEKPQAEVAVELAPDSADEYITAESDNNSSSGADDEVGIVTGDQKPVIHSSAATKNPDSMEGSKCPTRPGILATGRAVTAPTQLTIKAPSLSELDPSTPATKSGVKEPSALSSSVDSFRSFHSPISPLPPSPPYSDPPSPLLSVSGDIEMRRLRLHTRDHSEITITADTPNYWAPIHTPTRSKHDPSLTASPETPKGVQEADNEADEVWSDVMESPLTTELRYRSVAQRRRALSPLPLPANLFSPTSRASRQHLTTAIIQKTCAILLGPPVQLVALMLNIARKIANGATRGIAFGFGEAGETIPCRWDHSDADERRSAPWDEDDYEIALDSLAPNPRYTSHMSGSWEID